MVATATVVVIAALVETAEYVLVSNLGVVFAEALIGETEEIVILEVT